MTIIFERRKISDKVLLVQFQFDSHDIKINGSQVDGFSLDKYLSLDVWTQIYAKLEPIVEEYGKCIDTKPKEDTIQMRRAQLELQITWRTLQPFYKEIMRSEKKNLTLCQFVMIVKVNAVSLIDKYKRQHSQEKLSQKSQTQRKPDNTDATRSSNGSSSNDVEEYVPAARSNIENNLDYIPATLSNSVEKKIKKNSNTDEYTPVMQVADDDIVTYTPTKIEQQKELMNKYKSQAKTDVNRNDFPDKKKRADDLFGESDEPDRQIKSNFNLRSKTSTQTTTKVAVKQQKSMDKWVTTRQIKIENSGSNVDMTKKRKIDETAPIESSHAKHSNIQNPKDEEAMKLRALAREWEREENEKQVVIDEILDLKSMSNTDIIDTFEEHEKFLTKKFRSYSKVPDFRINLPKNEFDYLLILDGLVVQEQQNHMYKKLRAIYCKSNTDADITTDHENLLWQVMIPEWALQIFMDQNFYTREEAVKRLEQQDEAKIASDYPL